MSFEDRERQEQAFLSSHSVRQLMRDGFNISPFSIGARPDGFHIMHHDFDHIADEFDNAICLTFTGYDLSNSLENMLKQCRGDVSDYLYRELQALKHDYVISSH